MLVHVSQDGAWYLHLLGAVAGAGGARLDAERVDAGAVIGQQRVDLERALRQRVCALLETLCNISTCETFSKEIKMVALTWQRA